MNTTPTITPNDGQEKAAEGFFDFLLSDGKEFIISGPAGTGKTALMSYLIDIIKPQYDKSCELLGIKPEFDEVIMTATTNKAAEVLGVATGRPTSTVHSFLNLRVREDFDKGKTFLSRTQAWQVHQRKIIFIDECSMIDSDLYNILNEGTQNCKIIYVGDHNQLAPVFEKLSPIYRQNSPFYELTEPMRNNGQPALMEVCQQLRETVETGVFKPISLVPGVIDLLDDDQMQQNLMDTFVPGPNLDSRVLAFTNKQVMLFNQYIREQRQLPPLFTEGEILVNNSAIKIGNNQLSVEQEVKVEAINGIKTINITKEDSLEVQNISIRTSFGDIINNVNIPTDPEYFSKLLKWFASKTNWERHFFLKNNFADLRPRDAATVHKSQGSTYDSVFIDLDNISKCTQPDMAARMLYVAFSRAKHKIYLYGKLTERFGGLKY